MSRLIRPGRILAESMLRASRALIGVLASPLLIATTAVALAGNAMVTQAQGGKGPLIRIEPRNQMFLPGSVVTVTVYWCGDQYGWYPESRDIRLGGYWGPSILSSFSEEMWSYPNCTSAAKHVGQVTVPYGGLTIFARADAGYTPPPYTPLSGEDEVTYTSPPRTRGVEVTGPGRYITAVAGQTLQRVFSVVNTGGARDTFSLNLSCTNHSGACSGVPSSVILDSGQVAAYTISVGVSATPGTIATASLSASRPATPTATAASGGSSIEITSAILPPQGVSLARRTDVIERDLCITAGIKGGMSQCGDYVTGHALPAMRTMNRDWIPTLVYNSRHATPRPIITADVAITGGTPDSVTAILSVSGVERTRGKWMGNAWSAGWPQRIGLSYDGSSDASGVYSFTLEVRKWYGSSFSVVGSPSAELIHINRMWSHFGAGWWLGGLETLQAISGNRLLWIGGDGSARIFSPVTSSVWIATNIDRPDTLFADVNVWRRLLPNGARTEFDALGRHIASISRYGVRTQFDWDANGKMWRINMPVPAGTVPSPSRYEITYDADGISTAAAIGTTGTSLTRTITAAKSGRRITSLTDPDGSVVTFQYDAAFTNRMSARLDRRQAKTLLSYDVRGHTVTAAKTPIGGSDSLVVQFTDVFRRGLRDGNGGDEAVHADSAYTLIDGPRTDGPDHTKFWVNNLGAPVRVQNALGQQSRATYGHPTFPALVTEATGTNGYKTFAHYNSRGLIDSTVAPNFRTASDPTSAITRYTWHSKWAMPTRITQPMGNYVDLSYNAISGNREWEQPGADANRRITFRYNALGQITRVFPPLRPSGVGDSVAYDPLGNVNATITAKGHTTTYGMDPFGRVVLSKSPIDTLGHKDSTKTYYDNAGRPWMTVSYTPRLTTPSDPAIDSLTVTQSFDLEGNVWANNRYFLPTPGSSSLALIQTTWSIDTLGRPRSKSAPEGATESYIYDKAGNVKQVTTERGHTVTTEYDILNRAVRRITPSVTYGQTPCQVSSWQSCTYMMPTRGTSVVIPTDTAIFRHDAAGNVVQADNRYARISRGHSPSGLLLSETQRLRTWHPSLGQPGDPVHPSAAVGGSWSFTFPEGWNQSCEPNCNQQQRLLPSRISRIKSKKGKKSGFRAALEPQFLIIGGGVTYNDALNVGLAADFNSHVYAMTYRYDLNGRRDTLYLPAQLTPCPGSGCRKYQTYTYDGNTGALTGSVDLWNLSHALGYDYAGRLTSTTSPGWTTGYGYDYDDQRTSFTSGSTTTNFSNDLRGRIVRAVIGGSWQVDNDYSGSGPLLKTAAFTPTAGTEEFTYNALGSRMSSKNWISYSPGNDNGIRNYSNDWTGRVESIESDPAINGSFRFNDVYEYDNAGNTHVNYGRDWQFSNHSWLWEARSYYAADNKLAVFNRHTGWDVPSDNTVPRRPVFEEYRYDALGRRIGIRSRREATCNPSTILECNGYLQRVVWDGDQVLYEIRTEGHDTLSVAVLENDNPSTWTTMKPYGVVTYTHLMGIDRPAVIIKTGANGQTQVVVPKTNWRGAYESGHIVAGATPNMRWPGQDETVDAQPWPSGSMLDWFGDLVTGMADGSGQKYMRNRYYDPRTGRFTQKDPVGLAGGINLYGYAAGDPVTYSDPFGLWIVVHGLQANLAISNLILKSATFRGIYSALLRAPATQVNITIRPAQSAVELSNIQKLEYCYCAYAERDTKTPNGRIIFNPDFATDMSFLQSWFPHELVHAAGQFSSVTKVDPRCGGNDHSSGSCLDIIWTQITNEVKEHDKRTAAQEEKKSKK
jgi:RHS repeat-associated protein